MKEDRMFGEICKLEGKRYEGEFRGVRRSREIRRKALVAGYTIEIYPFYEGVGVIRDKEKEEKKILYFTTWGTFYNLPSNLEETIMNFPASLDKKIREKDRKRLVDYVLKKLNEVKSSDIISTIILMPHSKEELVKAGFIPDEKGQFYLAFSE